MTAPIAVLITWLLFGGLHLLLTRSWIRPRLIERFSDKYYIVAYTLLAAASLTVMIIVTARFGSQGISGANLGQYPAARWALGAIAFLGAGLSGAGLLSYSKSTVARLNRRARKALMASTATKPSALPVPALERVSRHPFFAGFAMLMGAHALLASHLAGVIFFGGFALLSILGIWIQDRKLLSQHPEAYAQHIENTAVIGGTGQADATWISVAAPALLQVVLIAIAMLVLHQLWLYGYGAPFTALLVLGALFAVVGQIRAEARKSNER